MANIPINSPKDFDITIKEYLTSEDNHADTFNQRLERLVNNQAYLKQLDIIESTVNPTESDDNYKIGNLWVNTAENKFFLLTDNTTNNALWIEITTEISYESKIYGVEYNEITDSYKRISNARGMQPEDFNSLDLYNRSKICNLADDGTVNAYIDDPTFKWDGSNGMVMREIDKFWYKHEDIEQGYRRYFSLKNRKGFKVHPAFINNGNIVEHIYCGVFEATLYDTSAGTFKGDGVTYDYNNDKLASVAGYQPLSGADNSFTRSQARQLAGNRGSGWTQNLYPGREALNLLHLIQYANYDMQSNISVGITNLESGSGNHSQNTGHTTSLNGESGEVVISSLENGATGASETYAMSFLGIENYFGNIWEWVDGVNIKDLTVYIAPGPPFEDDVFSGRYQSIGVTMTNSNGYISKIARNENYDYGTLPSEAKGSSSTYLCDYYYQNSGNRVLQVGGPWNNSLEAGPATWAVHSSSATSHRRRGSRLWFRNNPKN